MSQNVIYVGIDVDDERYHGSGPTSALCGRAGSVGRLSWHAPQVDVERRT